jgi:Rrf2 family iron-sulfur cluster assembly transcriptional regulator
MKEQIVKLTTKGRYAVMAMADLARHSSGNPVALAEIAERQEIEPIKATRCELGSPKGCLPSSGRCITHDLWEGLSHQIQLYLGSVSLGDVIDGRVTGRASFEGRPQAEPMAANAAD